MKFDLLFVAAASTTETRVLDHHRLKFLLVYVVSDKSEIMSSLKKKKGKSMLRCTAYSLLVNGNLLGGYIGLL